MSKNTTPSKGQQSPRLRGYLPDRLRLLKSLTATLIILQFVVAILFFLMRAFIPMESLTLQLGTETIAVALLSSAVLSTFLSISFHEEVQFERASEEIIAPTVIRKMKSELCKLIPEQLNRAIFELVNHEEIYHRSSVILDNAKGGGEIRVLTIAQDQLKDNELQDNGDWGQHLRKWLGKKVGSERQLRRYIAIRPKYFEEDIESARKNLINPFAGINNVDQHFVVADIDVSITTVKDLCFVGFVDHIRLQAKNGNPFRHAAVIEHKVYAERVSNWILQRFDPHNGPFDGCRVMIDGIVEEENIERFISEWKKNV